MRKGTGKTVIGTCGARRPRVWLHSASPISGTAPAVCDSKNVNGATRFAVNHEERKTRKLRLASPARSPGPTLGSIENSFDHGEDFRNESCSRSGASLAIPARCCLSFLDCGGVEREPLGGHSAAEESLRRACSSETGLTLPELRSAMRRRASRSHAASTDSSSASSRLSIRDPASSARSATESARAFFSRSIPSSGHICILAPIEIEGYRFPWLPAWFARS